MDGQCPGLTDALGPDWNGGAFRIVLDDGDVEVRDEAMLEAEFTARA